MKTVLFCFVGRVDNNSVHFGSGYLFCSDQLESYSWCGFNDLPRGGLSVHDENCGLCGFVAIYGAIKVPLNLHA
jgi:hypothetical protein